MSTRPRIKRIPKTDLGVGTRRATKPVCPLHDIPMSYRPDELRWACEYILNGDKCKMVSYPKHEAGRPVIGTGSPEILIQDRGVGASPRLILKAPGNNVCIDITTMLGSFDISKAPDGKDRLIIVLHTDAFYNIDSKGKAI